MNLRDAIIIAAGVGGALYGFKEDEKISDAAFYGVLAGGAVWLTTEIFKWGKIEQQR